MGKFRIVIKAFAYGMMIASPIIMFWTFLTAYFGNKSTIVYINNYGEAHWELVLLSFALICMIVEGIYWYKENATRRMEGRFLVSKQDDTRNNC